MRGMRGLTGDEKGQKSGLSPTNAYDARGCRMEKSCVTTEGSARRDAGPR